MCDETNKQANTITEETNDTGPRLRIKWVDVNVEELSIFCIRYTYNVKSNINNYWSTKKFYQPIFGKTMACDRCKVISWYLHFSLSPEPNDMLKYRQWNFIIKYSDERRLS